MGLASPNNSISHDGFDEQATKATTVLPPALLADLIPALVVLIYALGITCWFRGVIWSCFRKPIFQRWTRRTADGWKGDYMNVAKEDDDEEVVDLQRLPSMMQHRRDEELIVGPSAVNVVSLVSKKIKKRPERLNIRGYTPLSSFSEDCEGGEEASLEIDTRAASIDPSLECQQQEPQNWLGLSKYFDNNTGQLQKHILLDPGTELSEMRVKEEDGMFEYDGGFGDNILGRWCDRAIRWAIARAQPWLEPAG
ncbi:predicted protein [Uncinocarpus reesii 1704]|uniref:Uncharacterized protein n=1 Tax=Uncinocarpus reesii (strain UAMH 1704) TaxID=336963 RepID=C4JLR9_UNCRE|nr:uncharacterized protein UREG_03777 [Uncinocarpus reesii 1704]EEP78931.1 predicted protein [Uncinocarpus reesii 1704]